MDQPFRVHPRPKVIDKGWEGFHIVLVLGKGPLRQLLHLLGLGPPSLRIANAAPEYHLRKVKLPLHQLELKAFRIGLGQHLIDIPDVPFKRPTANR